MNWYYMSLDSLINMWFNMNQQQINWPTLKSTKVLCLIVKVVSIFGHYSRNNLELL